MTQKIIKNNEIIEPLVYEEDLYQSVFASTFCGFNENFVKWVDQIIDDEKAVVAANPS